MTTNKPSAVIPELFAYEGTAMNSFFLKICSNQRICLNSEFCVKMCVSRFADFQSKIGHCEVPFRPRHLIFGKL